MLSALIRAHGPLPCLHVARVRQRHPTPPDVSSIFRIEVSELRFQDGGVILERRPFANVPEPTDFQTREDARLQRDVLCEALSRIPWDRTSAMRRLTPDDAAAALRHVQVSPEGMKVLPKIAPKISALTFENHTQSTPDKAEQGTI